MAAPADHALAERLAREAGRTLLELQSQTGASQTGASQTGAPRRWQWGLAAAGDGLAHRLIVDELRRRRPADAVLSEEGHDDPRRLRAQRVWIVDPLDGSSNFANGGETWAVHVGLCESGEPSAGAVAVPTWGEVFTADPPPPPPERRIGPMRRADRLKIAVPWMSRRSHALELAAALDAAIVALGSAGYKAMAVVSGLADAYVTAGGLCEWDTCAPAAVAAAAGLHVSRIDGSRLRFNRPVPCRHDGLVICRPDLADELLGVVSAW